MKPNRPSLTLAALVFLFLVAPPALAQEGEPFGPHPTRRQLHAVGAFAGDAMFKQPMVGVSETFQEPRKTVTGTAVVESVSGHIMLPRGQHLWRLQLVNSVTDPVRSEVLATLEFTLASVTDDFVFYAVSLRSPVRIPDANAFGVFVLRDAATASRNGEVALVLNIIQPR